MATSRVSQRPANTSTTSGTATSTELKPQAKGAAQDRAPATPDVQTEGAELSPEAAAAAQATWGNDLVQAATRSGATGVDAGGLDGAGTEASQELGEAVQQEEALDTAKDAETARGNAATTSGSGLAAPRGIEVEAPWSAGRWFGGDDDTPLAGAPTLVAGWTPPPADLDADDPLEGAADSPAALPEDPLDLTEAREALGYAPLPSDPLNLGLRHAESLAALDFDATTLALLPPRSAFARARSALRFLAEEGPAGIAPIAALAIGAGEAVGPASGGLAGATARALGQLQLLLSAAPVGWRGLVEVVLQTSARPRAELAAAALGDLRRLSATTLWAMVIRPTDGEPYDLLPSGAHPAARAALARVATLAPLPDVVFPRPLEEEAPAADPWAQFMLAWTAGVDATEVGYAPIHARWDALLAALGERHVAVAAAAIALSTLDETLSGAEERPADALIGTVLQRFVRALRRAVSPALDAADAAQRTRDYALHLAACEALAEARLIVHELTELTLDALGASLLAKDAADVPLPEVVHPALDAARAALRAGRGPLAVGPLEDAIAALAEPALGPALGLVLTSIRGALALSQGDQAAAVRCGERLRGTGLPFAQADGALLIVAAQADGSWQDTLRETAARVAGAGEGGALNLLVAGWAERAAAGRTPEAES